MMNFLLLARLFVITGSSIATSFLWLSYALPSIFFGPIGAASVDLVSRRKILMLTNLLQAATVFTYIFIFENSIYLLYLIVLLYSFFNQFYIPAESSSVPSLVSKKDLPQANGLFIITQQFALVIGMGLAGIIQKILGFSGSLILCSTFLFLAFISVSFLPEMKPSTKIPQSIDKFLVTFFKSIYEGYKFIKNSKPILIALGFILAIQVSLAMVVVNLPVIATQVLRISIEYAGIAIVIPAGIGAILSSLVITRYLKRGWRKKVVIEYSLLIAALAIFLLITLPLVVLPLLLFMLGASFVGFSVPTITFLQEKTPEWLRGRVFGNLWFLVSISTVFPVLFSGLITEFFGVKLLLIGIAAGTFLAFLYSRAHGQALIEENFEK
jgi:MFS family permease